MVHLDAVRPDSNSPLPTHAVKQPADDGSEEFRPQPTIVQRRASGLRRRAVTYCAADAELAAAPTDVTAAAGGVGAQAAPSPPTRKAVTLDLGVSQAKPALLSRRPGKAKTLELGYLRLPAADCTEDAGDDVIGVYSSLQVLGRGAFGTVFQARQETTGRVVALKLFHARDGSGASGSARSEHEVMCRLDHPRIVRALDFFVHRGEGVSVMELFIGASISRALRKTASRGFPEGDSRSLFRALLEALSYMHCKGYVHRDVKPENVLVSEDLRDLRLIDFNLACLSSEVTSLSCVGTEFYAAPEVLAGALPTEANDMWGAGVCLHMMLSGRAPELCGAPAGSAEGVAEPQLSGGRWARASEAARCAARKCLALDAQLRPTASGMLEHPWVSSADELPATASPGRQQTI